MDATSPGWGLPFANPEILGEPPEVDFQLDDDDPKLDPRYTGGADFKPEDPECFDPDVLKGIESEYLGTWLGKWFAHHYAAWVSKFYMTELKNYEINKETSRDSVTTPLPMLCWTFRRFRLQDTTWRDPLFGEAVRHYLFQTEKPLTSSKFRKGLKRFRSEVVSSLRACATSIFGISDIEDIEDRGASAQVAALCEENEFLYAQGNTVRINRYLRSECILKGCLIAYPVQQTLSHYIGAPCCSVGSRCTQRSR